MKYKIVMEDKVYKKLFCLMRNINEINDGNEIAMWMLGKWENNEDEIVLIIDGMIMPEQAVSSVDVEIKESDMINTIKENGIEVSNRIVGHWHIHPFGKGKPSWSSDDDEKIEKFMDFKKGRELFVFMLSSEDELIGRVEYRGSTIIRKINRTIINKESIDELEVFNLNDLKEEEEMINELKEEVKKKIREYTPNLNKFICTEEKDGNINNIISTGYTEMFLIKKKKNKLICEISYELYNESMRYLSNDTLIDKYDSIKYTNSKMILIYNNMSKEDMDKLEKELEEYETLYYENQYMKDNNPEDRNDFSTFENYYNMR